MDSFQRVTQTCRPLQVDKQLSNQRAVFITFLQKPENRGRFMDNFRNSEKLQIIIESDEII